MSPDMRSDGRNSCRARPGTPREARVRLHRASSWYAAGGGSMRWFLAVVTVGSMLACSGKPADGETDGDADTDTDADSDTDADTDTDTDPYVIVMTTTMGEIEIELDPENAPTTAAN